MFHKSILILFLLALALTSSQASLAAPNDGPIFSDDFESGNLLAWSSKKTDKGDLAVTWPAAIEGAKGMRARIDDTHHMYVVDDTPDSEVSYYARFLFEPNGISMADNSFHTIFLAEDLRDSYTPVVRVELKFSSASYRLRAGVRNDDLTWSKTRWVAIGGYRPLEIYIEWEASEAPGMNNGRMMFYLNWVLEYITGIDNDTFQVDRARLGAMGGMDDTTSGTYFIDSFGWSRDIFTGLRAP